MARDKNILAQRLSWRIESGWSWICTDGAARVVITPEVEKGVVKWEWEVSNGNGKTEEGMRAGRNEAIWFALGKLEKMGVDIYQLPQIVERAW
jgi:hypothetical protein